MTAIDSVTPKFKELLTKADTLLKMKVLTLAFVLELDGAGWTRPISERQLFNAMGLSRSKSQAVNLKVYLAELEAAGAIASCCEKGSKKKYRFHYLAENVASSGGNSRQNVERQVAENIASGGGDSPPENSKAGNSTPLFGRQNPPPPDSESDRESEALKADTVLSVRGLLKGVGVGENNLYLADEWSVEEIQALIDSSRKRNVKNFPAYLVGCLKQGKNGNAFDQIRQAYEQHIGSITPMIYESIQAAMKVYAVSWIVDAVVESKHTSWAHVEKILARWQVQGRKPLPEKKSADKPSYNRSDDHVDPEARRKMNELRRLSWERSHGK